MTMPYYVAPEQVMKDRAEYAQKGIARGRALVGTTYDNGVLIVAENPSNTLHKISEIYDRVAFAGVGRYNEFDQLRVAGVRHADTKGYAYSREDVDARSLANVYAQYLGQVFTHEMKPLEVEILVAELDPLGDAHQLFHIAYDGTVADEQRFTVLGGEADAIAQRMTARFVQGWLLARRSVPVWPACPAPPALCTPRTWKWRSSNTAHGVGPSGTSETRKSPPCWPMARVSPPRRLFPPGHLRAPETARKAKRAIQAQAKFRSSGRSSQKM